MAEFNSCAKLLSNEKYSAAAQKYNELLEEGRDPFAYMLNMQKELQHAVSKKKPAHNPNPNELNTLGQKFDWLRESKQAFDDEYREIIDALPGMSMPEKDRSALWKRWKEKYDDVRAMSFDDLSEEDLTELKFELCDSFHFYMNMFFALDMSSEEMFIYYFYKNAENFERIKNGY